MMPRTPSARKRCTNRALFLTAVGLVCLSLQVQDALEELRQSIDRAVDHEELADRLDQVLRLIYTDVHGKTLLRGAIVLSDDVVCSCVST